MQNQRAITLLLFANSISGVAQGIAMLTVPWYFTGIIHREDLFGKTYLLVTVISLVWGVYAGTLIDRYSRKSIFLAVNAIGFFAISLVSAAGFVQGQLHWAIVASVFAVTAFIYNIHYPNLYAFAQEITPGKEYARVTSLLEIQGQITFTLSGGLAAILLNGLPPTFTLLGQTMALPFSFNAWPVHRIFAIGVITYLITFVLISQIRWMPLADKKIDTSPLPERLKAGFRFLKKHPLLFHFGNASLLVFLTIIIFGTFIATMFVHSFLNEKGYVYALGEMFFAMGSLMAGFLTTRVFAGKSAVRGVIVLTFTAAAMYAFMLTNRLPVLYYAANFVLGACNASIRIQRVTYLFHHIPNHVIGRANSIFFVVNVLLRLLLIGLFNLPLFHQSGGAAYAVAVFVLVCITGAVLLLTIRQRLEHQPEVK